MKPRTTPDRPAPEGIVCEPRSGLAFFLSRPLRIFRSLRREDLPEHPQIRANELLVESVHPHVGPMREARPAVRFEHTPADIRRPAPALGEHTDEILAELGCEPSEIADLREARVVA